MLNKITQYYFTVSCSITLVSTPHLIMIDFRIIMIIYKSNQMTTFWANHYSL